MLLIGAIRGKGETATTLRLRPVDGDPTLWQMMTEAGADGRQVACCATWQRSLRSLLRNVTGDGTLLKDIDSATVDVFAFVPENHALQLSFRQHAVAQSLEIPLREPLSVKRKAPADRVDLIHAIGIDPDLKPDCNGPLSLSDSEDEPALPASPSAGSDSD